jgi:uncharacterized membrane protein
VEHSGTIQRHRPTSYRHPVNRKLHDERTFGQRAADHFTNAFGTWTYIIIQTLIIVAWISANVVGFIYEWDAYPFILLNLGFSAQASYAAPLILMAANRSAQVDRLTLEHDAVQTDSILTLQQTQLDLLNAIKQETALLKEIHRHLDPSGETPPTSLSG